MLRPRLEDYPSLTLSGTLLEWAISKGIARYEAQARRRRKDRHSGGMDNGWAPHDGHVLGVKTELAAAIWLGMWYDPHIDELRAIDVADRLEVRGTDPKGGWQDALLGFTEVDLKFKWRYPCLLTYASHVQEANKVTFLGWGHLRKLSRPEWWRQDWGKWCVPLEALEAPEALLQRRRERWADIPDDFYIRETTHA